MGRENSGKYFLSSYSSCQNVRDKRGKFSKGERTDKANMNITYKRFVR